MSRLKPYLTYSGALHFVFFLFGWRLINRVTPPPTAVYSIDFVGSTSIQDASAAGGASPVAAPAPGGGAFLSKPKRVALPKPSLLTGYREPARAPQAAAISPGPGSADAASSPGAASASGPPGSPEAGVATDMPNFPYPWYISQVRSSLWSQWSRRLPESRGEAIVVFSILPGGQLTDLRVELSSGDGAFDLTALGAVQDAAPFAPLPRGFGEPFLKIHLTLKR